MLMIRFWASGPYYLIFWFVSTMKEELEQKSSQLLKAKEVSFENIPRWLI